MLTTLASILAMSIPSAQEIVERSWKETLAVGHRGSAGTRPENALSSFEAAVSSGAVATECDVHVSRDGKLMVIHDSTLDRTTALEGNVSQTDAATMVAAGVPTLADYLDVTKDRIVSVIEIKAGEGVVPKVVAEVRSRQMELQTILFSFNADFIRQAEEIAPELFTVWLKGEPKDVAAHFAELDSIKADGVAVHFKGASAELVAEAHRRRMPVFVWTVPPGNEVQRLQSLKVNFIITDHPRSVVDQLGS